MKAVELSLGHASGSTENVTNKTKQVLIITEMPSPFVRIRSHTFMPHSPVLWASHLGTFIAHPTDIYPINSAFMKTADEFGSTVWLSIGHEKLGPSVRLSHFGTKGVAWKVSFGRKNSGW